MLEASTLASVTRIIAGAAGSLRLDVPKQGTRPTSDRVREALFSALEARDLVRGANVLDLYAGSGALGLEALSRGAARVLMVEKAPAAAKVCAGNAARVAKALGSPANAVRVLTEAAERFATQSGEQFDLVLIDPPYQLPADQLELVLGALPQLLAAQGVVVLEQRSGVGVEWPAGLEADAVKRYGDTELVWAIRTCA